MKRLRPLHRALATLTIAASLSSLVSAQGDMKRKYEAKLKEPFIEYGGWLTDYDQARERAKAEGKVLFVYFSRSYAP